MTATAPAPPAAPRIAAILTCFNRRALTLRGLAALHEAARVAGVSLAVYLVDDGSRDGTADAVRAAYPDATVIPGDGSLYWNGGMRRAWSRALDDPTDFFLWLNDDLAIDPDALANALRCYCAQPEPAAIVGRTVDPESGVTTYGTYRRAEGASQLRYRLLRDDESDGDTMNGNFVLLPATIVDRVGILDGAYRHAYGDIDYGLRIRLAGYRIVECKQPVGRQADNIGYTESTSVLTLRNARFILTDPKGVPVREWLHFCRRHAGVIWPVNFFTRYVKMAARGLKGTAA